MILHTEFFTPFRFPTGALIIVAFLRMDNAGVTLRQFLKTRITVTLTEAFIRAPTAVGAINLTIEMQSYMALQQRIERNILIAQRQAVTHWSVQSAC